MKMKISIAAGCALLLIGLTFPVHAAETPAGSKEELFDLDFAGGTVAQLSAAIEKASGKKPNLLISAEVAAYEIPAISVRSVRQDLLLKAIGTLLNQDQKKRMTIWEYPEGSGIWTVAGRQGDKNCQVFHLGKYLKQYKVEDIITAIQTSWKMMDPKGKNPLELKFHKETELLLALVDQTQMPVINGVLIQLSQGLTRPSVPEPPAAPPTP